MKEETIHFELSHSESDIDKIVLYGTRANSRKEHWDRNPIKIIIQLDEYDPTYIGQELNNVMTLRLSALRERCTKFVNTMYKGLHEIYHLKD